METVYETLLEISSAVGAENLPIEACQQYLDQPAGYVAEDEVPLVSCMDSQYLLDVVTRVKKEIHDEHGDEDFDRVAMALEAKRVATAALCTIHHSTDADAVAMAARLLLMLCRLPGAESFGFCTTNVLTVIAQSIGRVTLDAMKSTAKRPAPGMKNGKKTKTRGPPVEGTRRSQRMAVDEDYEEEEEDEEEGEEEGMDLTQASSSTQLTDPFQLSQGYLNLTSSHFIHTSPHVTLHLILFQLSLHYQAYCPTLFSSYKYTYHTNPPCFPLYITTRITASQEVALDAGKLNSTGRRALESSVSGSVIWSFLKDLTPVALALYTDRMTSHTNLGTTIAVDYWLLNQTIVKTTTVFGSDYRSIRLLLWDIIAGYLLRTLSLPSLTFSVPLPLPRILLYTHQPLTTTTMTTTTTTAPTIPPPILPWRLYVKPWSPLCF